jgi:hypothetical protein
MKQSLFHPEFTEGLFTCSGTKHTNIPDDLDKLKTKTGKLPIP